MKFLRMMTESERLRSRICRFQTVKQARHVRFIEMLEFMRPSQSLGLGHARRHSASIKQPAQSSLNITVAK